MSGFGSTIGFIFSFFVIIGFFVSAFFIYTSQVIYQAENMEQMEEDFAKVINTNYELSMPYLSSGKVNFVINNQNSNVLTFSDRDGVCFDIYVNGKFIQKEDIIINPENGNLLGSYSMIEGNSYGIMSISNINLNNDSTIKIISCSGDISEFVFQSKNIDWYNKKFESRKRISVKNNAATSIAEYQVNIDFNGSNLDFNTISKTDFKIAYPLTENLVLDINFDEFKQQLDDFSKYSNTISLGSVIGVDVNDPNEDTFGVTKSALNFDGVDDYVSISTDPSLEIDKEITIATWIKWDDTSIDAFNNIFTNGGANNALSMVNDAGVNQGKILFNLDIGGVKSLYSNVTLDNNWHFITATFNGGEMKLYIDTNQVGNLTIDGEITPIVNTNYVGTQGGGSEFKGEIDELKVYNLALSNQEIEDLYYNNLKFRELDFYITSWDVALEKAKMFVKIPIVSANSNITFDIYYDNFQENIDYSSIKNTFSYEIPRTVGYVVNERISSSTGLNIFSLYDNNTIYVGNDKFNLNKQQGNTLASGSIILNDNVRMKYLGQVEGNGQGDDIIAPISWANTEFYFRGFRNNPDRFCILSPWGNAWVEIFDTGILLWNATVDGNGGCYYMNIGTNNALRLASDIPVLVSYYGDTFDDAFVFYKADDEDIYGVPSGSMYLGAGPLGANVDVYESDGVLSSYTIGSYGTVSDTGPGPDGSSTAYKISSNNPVGAIQQADGDGSESTVFVSENEMSNYYGSNEATDYIVAASPNANANCSIYDSTSTLIGNQATGVGTNGIYFYGFGEGNDIQYVGARWIIECDEPIWPYYENSADNDDETNLFGHLQMRQYIYPEPSVSILN